MKTYIVQHQNTSLPKQEIRGPYDTDLNERLRDDYHAVRVAQPMTMNYASGLNYGSTDYVVDQIVFESHRLVTMYWVEEYERGGRSFGYYNRFISYFQVLQGTDMSGMFGVSEGEEFYSRLNTRSMDGRDYYESMHHMESLIIRTPPNVDIKELVEEKKPVQHFDEKIFEID